MLPGADRHADQRRHRRGRAPTVTQRDRRLPVRGADARASTRSRSSCSGFRTAIHDKLQLAVDTATQARCRAGARLAGGIGRSRGDVADPEHDRREPRQRHHRHPDSAAAARGAKPGRPAQPPGRRRLSADRRSAQRIGQRRAQRSVERHARRRRRQRPAVRATPTTRCCASRSSRCRSSASARATTAPTWAARARRRCRWSPRAAPTGSRAPATSRSATPSWSSNEYFLKLTQLQSGPAEQAAQAGQEQLRRRARRPDQARSPVLLRQLRGAAANRARIRSLRNVPVGDAARRRAGLRLRRGVGLPGRHACAASPSTHSIPAGRYGLTPAEIAGLDPLGIGAEPRRVRSLQEVSDAERSRPRRHQLHGLSLLGADRERVQHLHHAASTT